MFILKLNLKTYIIHFKRFLFFICFTVLLCIFAGVIGDYFLYADKAFEAFSIAVVDLDDSIESRLFYDAVFEFKEYKDLIAFDKVSQEQAQELMEEKDVVAVITIPKDFVENVKNGTNEPVSVVYNSSSPIRAKLVEYFANAFAQILKASQISVYSALDYSKENLSEEQYLTTFRNINLKYLNLALNRGQMVEKKMVLATGDVGVFEYYFIVSYIFLMFTSSLLFIDVLQKNFNKNVLVRLKKQGTNSLRIIIENIFSVFTILILINAFFASIVVILSRYMAIKLEVSLSFICLIMMVLFCISAFTVLFSALFKNILSAGIFISIISISGLFLSGGIIPIDFLPESLKFIGKYTFNYSATQLLCSGYNGVCNLDALMIITLFIFVAIMLALLAYNKNAKVGDRL